MLYHDASMNCRPFAALAAIACWAAAIAIVAGCKGVSGHREVVSTPQTTGDGLASASGQYVVIYKTHPTPIPLNAPFDIDVRVLDAKNRSEALRDIKLDVDGRMPHHRHGMNRQPQVTQRSDGSFHVQGMLFHMPGRWELYFDVTRDGRTERAQDVIFLD